MQIPRWRNLSILRYSIGNSSLSSPQFAYFHSSPISCEKWKNKWSSDSKGAQQPSKSYIKYKIREKRANGKKALKGLLYNSGSSRFSFQNEDPLWKTDVPGWDAECEEHSYDVNKKGRSKGSPNREGKSNYKISRRKSKKDYFSEDDATPDHTFRATFGSRMYTWSFKLGQESTFFRFTNGFEWKDQTFTKGKRKEWDTTSETECDDETSFVGSYAERTLLGLPPRGPLKMEDVKNAFRLAAKKWHPDMHQGPSQGMAEEKFKLCVNAYKSLCSQM